MLSSDSFNLSIRVCFETKVPFLVDSCPVHIPTYLYAKLKRWKQYVYIKCKKQRVCLGVGTVLCHKRLWMSQVYFNLLLGCYFFSVKVFHLHICIFLHLSKAFTKISLSLFRYDVKYELHLVLKENRKTNKNNQSWLSFFKFQS